MFDTFIGVDISKDKFNYCVVDKQLEIVKEGLVEMNKEGFNSFLDVIQSFKNAIVAVESTGCYHTNLISFLYSKDISISLINPIIIKRFSQSVSLRNTKTDIIDAFFIARFIAKHTDYIDRFRFKSSEFVNIARMREKITGDVAKAKTVLKQHLSVVFPEFVANFNPFTNTALRLLLELPIPYLIRNINPDSIREIITSCNTRRTVAIEPEGLIELAKNSIGQSNNGWDKIIPIDVETIIFLSEQLKTITEVFIDMVNSSMQEQMEIITSIKGISETTAAHFLAEVKDIKRFAKPNKLSAYAGIDPSIKQSGRSINLRGKISKKGNRSLRRTIYLMAMGVMKFNEQFREYYLKKRGEGMPHRKAMIALCNKLIRVIYAMLIKEEMFHPSPSY